MEKHPKKFQEEHVPHSLQTPLVASIFRSQVLTKVVYPCCALVSTGESATMHLSVTNTRSGTQPPHSNIRFTDRDECIGPPTYHESTRLLACTDTGWVWLRFFRRGSDSSEALHGRLSAVCINQVVEDINFRVLTDYTRD